MDKERQKEMALEIIQFLAEKGLVYSEAESVLASAEKAMMRARFYLGKQISVNLIAEMAKQDKADNGFWFS